MAKATTTKKTTTTCKRARTDEGKFIKDDPSTPDVNEAWVEEAVAAEEPKAAKKSAPKPKADDYVWFQSREQEPSMFPVAGISPIRNFSSGRLEYRVPAQDVDRFTQNHFVTNARIVRKV